MNFASRFNIEHASAAIDADSPIKGDLGLVAAVFQSAIRHIAEQGKAAAESNNSCVACQTTAALGAATSLVVSISINLPIELQRSFIDACGLPDYLAEELLGKARSEMAKLQS